MAGLPDYYAILQVHPRADKEIIEAAYRRLAAKHHPDKNPSPDAAERMKQLNVAYDVLSSQAKRAHYDATRRFGGTAFSQEGGHTGGPFSWGPSAQGPYPWGMPPFVWPQDAASRRAFFLRLLRRLLIPIIIIARGGLFRFLPPVLWLRFLPYIIAAVVAGCLIYYLWRRYLR